MTVSSMLALLVCFAFVPGAALDKDIDTRDVTFDHCPNGSVRHDSSCYLVSHELTNWPDALVFCQAYGAHLARIESDREQQFVGNWINSIMGSTSDTSHYYWIGGTDAVSEGEWYWASVVEPVTVHYTNWKHGEPNNNNAHTSHHQDCMAMYGDSGKWDDGWCEEAHNFICEINHIAMPGSLEFEDNPISWLHQKDKIKHASGYTIELSK